MVEIEDELHRSIENLIIEMRYGPRRMGAWQIAEELQISEGTVHHWSSSMGLTFRAVATQAMQERVQITGSGSVKALRRAGRSA
jgi:hypothetical protein